MSGANISKYHKGGSTAIPALTNVGTVTARTYGVEVIFFNQIFKLWIIFSVSTLHFHPVRETSFGIHFLKDFCKDNDY